MGKTNNVEKLVNGDVVDADPLNQIIENVGSEGGSIPYDDTTQNRANGTESLGQVAFPWGDFNMSREALLQEINTTTGTVSSSIALKNLRKFINQKDTPPSYAGAAGQAARVKDTEDGIEFATIGSTFFTSSGSFTVPSGVTLIYVTLVGAGGGGGAALQNTNDDGGGGGGGGELIYRHPWIVTPSAVINLTIGAVGTGGVNSGNAGVAGGDTIFDTSLNILKAQGGNGGSGGGTGTGAAAHVVPSSNTDRTGANAIVNTGGLIGDDTPALLKEYFIETYGGGNGANAGGGGASSEFGSGTAGTNREGGGAGSDAADCGADDYGCGGGASGGNFSGGNGEGGNGGQGFIVVEF